MSTVNLEIEIPERIRGTDLEKKLLQKAQKYALEQAVVELYKEGAISNGTGAELLQMRSTISSSSSVSIRFLSSATRLRS